MSTLCTPDGPARRGDLHEVGNQESSGASGDMNYDIMNYKNKNTVFFFEELQTNKPKNYIFTSKELKINLNMEQPKNHKP